jgi:SAM-dependent methyltransferase
MTVFGAYAKFYDALYQEKDYLGEVNYIERLFAQYAARPIKTILDLGCGSGGHAIPLAQRGFKVTGVDRSAEMLNEAKKKTSSGNPQFIQSDLTEVELGIEFDAIISMFAVFSYITENRDLARAFQIVRNHLQPGGLFFFDAWFGPAVLAERPSDRYKIIDQGTDKILRFAHPWLDILTHTVTVQYKIIHLSADRVLEELEEGHSMRFFFPREIEYHLVSSGFELLSIHPFMEETRVMNERDWNMAIVARVPLAAPSNETIPGAT